MNEIDYAAAFALNVDSEQDALNLERILHRVFHPFRLPAIAKVTRDGRGHTEWFKREAFPELCAFLKREEHILGFTKVDIVHPEPKMRPLTAATLRKREQIERKAAAARALQDTRQRLEALMIAQCTLLSEIAERCQHAGILGSVVYSQARRPLFVGVATQSAADSVQTLLEWLRATGELSITGQVGSLDHSAGPLPLYSSFASTHTESGYAFAFEITTSTFYRFIGQYSHPKDCEFLRNPESHPHLEKLFQRALQRWDRWDSPVPGWDGNFGPSQALIDEKRDCLKQALYRLRGLCTTRQRYQACQRRDMVRRFPIRTHVVTATCDGRSKQRRA